MDSLKAFAPPPKARSLLDYHRILSPSAAVRVSPLCLGALQFGANWTGAMGPCDYETSMEILDYFFENGGNFIDAANLYQEGDCESWVGDWMKSRNNREQMVIATKYSYGYRKAEKDIKIQSNFQGNSAKSMRHSLDMSLKRLKTDYIDLFYIHTWDFTTSIPELMIQLHREVMAGRIMYLGVSDTPAFVVSRANEYARCHGLTQFSVYQPHWNVLKRDVEREILPMCEMEGMALAPWSPSGSGRIRSAEDFAQNAGRKALVKQQPNDLKMYEVLNKIGQSKGKNFISIALAYLFNKAPYVYPIIGVRKLEHLKSNIESIGIELTKDEIKEIESVVPFDIGFPMDHIFSFGGDPYESDMTAKDVWHVKNSTHLDHPAKTQPIKPHGLE